MLASQHVELEFRYDALMHDASEAFIGDITKPLKRLLPDYQEIERRVEAAVFAKFGVSNPLPPEVKHIDLVLLATEQRDLSAPHGDEWGCLVGIQPLRQTIRPWTPPEACSEFLKRYEALKTWQRSTSEQKLR